MKALGTFLLLIGVGINAFATAIPPVPEIDTGLAVSSIALLGGALLILRARRKK